MIWEWNTSLQTSVGNPHQWNGGGEERLFMVAATRKGGGNDEHMPRRIAGVGADRADALRAFYARLRRVDPGAHVVVPTHDDDARTRVTIVPTPAG